MNNNKENSLVKIKTSRLHGRGLYALANIPKNKKIIEYVGEIISKKVGDKRADEQFKKSKKTGSGAVYIFDLNKKYDLDGDFSWNIAKFINHSCSPNCIYKIDKNRVWIVSIKSIKKGEEITFDYDYDLEDYKEHLCRCNSRNCLGYIIGKKYRKKFKDKYRII